MRIAVAGSAATTDNAHFGHAEFFRIFQVGGGRARLMETRPATAHCGPTGGDPWRLTRSVQLLADCAAVVAAAIGPCARDELSRHHIVAIEHDGPDPADVLSILDRTLVRDDRPAAIRTEETML